MFKKSIVLLLTLIMALLLVGCGCDHQWLAADCVNPMTCSLCGKTDGEPAGHVWMAATCDAPKTCENCGATDGEPKGHKWVDADCETAKHCENCDLTEGAPLGHQWTKATTENPTTCENCGMTEGERIITDPRFTTESTADLQGKWVLEVKTGAEDMGLPDFEGKTTFLLYMTFGEAGDLGFSIEVTEELIDAMRAYTIDSVYAEYAAQGVSQEAANDAFAAETGMTIEDYVNQFVSADFMNGIFAETFAALGLNGVYYVQNGTLYVGESWDGEMNSKEYTLNGDQLVIPELMEALQAENGFVRVPNQ